MNADILDLLNQAAAKYGLPPALVVAQAKAESGGDPNAVSSAGAQGVMQLMPATARSLGVTDPFDPAQNIVTGAGLTDSSTGGIDSGTVAMIAAAGLLIWFLTRGLG